MSSLLSKVKAAVTGEHSDAHNYDSSTSRMPGHFDADPSSTTGRTDPTTAVGSERLHQQGHHQGNLGGTTGAGYGDTSTSGYGQQQSREYQAPTGTAVGSNDYSTGTAPHSSNTMNTLDPRTERGQGYDNTGSSGAGYGQSEFDRQEAAVTGLDQSGRPTGYEQSGSGLGSGIGSGTGQSSGGLTQKPGGMFSSGQNVENPDNARLGTGSGLSQPQGSGILGSRSDYSREPGYETTTTTTTNTNTSTSTNAGPHSSSLANRADPRVDSDLDNSRNVGGQGYGSDQYGTSGTNYSRPSGAGYDSTSSGRQHDTDRGDDNTTTGHHHHHHHNKLHKKNDPRGYENYDIQSERDTGAGTAATGAAATGAAAYGASHGRHEREYDDRNTSSGTSGTATTGAAGYGSSSLGRQEREYDDRNTSSGISDTAATGATGYGTSSHGRQERDHDNRNTSAGLSGLFDKGHDGNYDIQSERDKAAAAEAGTGASATGTSSGNRGDREYDDRNTSSGTTSGIAGTAATGAAAYGASSHGRREREYDDRDTQSGTTPHSSSLMNKMDPRVESDAGGNSRQGRTGDTSEYQRDTSGVGGVPYESQQRGQYGEVPGGTSTSTGQYESNIPERRRDNYGTTSTNEPYSGTSSIGREHGALPTRSHQDNTGYDSSRSGIGGSAGDNLSSSRRNEGYGNSSYATSSPPGTSGIGAGEIMHQHRKPVSHDITTQDRSSGYGNERDTGYGSSAGTGTGSGYGSSNTATGTGAGIGSGIGSGLGSGLTGGRNDDDNDIYHPCEKCGHRNNISHYFNKDRNTTSGYGGNTTSGSGITGSDNRGGYGDNTTSGSGILGSDNRSGYGSNTTGGYGDNSGSGAGSRFERSMGGYGDNTGSGVGSRSRFDDGNTFSNTGRFEDHTLSTHGNRYEQGSTSGYDNNQSTSQSGAGPHSSSMMNKLDPRV